MKWQFLALPAIALAASPLASIRAQDPTPITPPPAIKNAAKASAKAEAPDAATRALADELNITPYRRRSVVQHYPHPYPDYYHGDATGGFRNPGGVGRYLEHYPANNQFQTGGKDPVKVAKFDQGGGAPDRAEQLQAQQLGVQRENAIQGHIDRYASPNFGYGVGYFGGFY